mgnify:CR=1 FL=1
MPRTDLYVNLSITGELAPFRIVAHDGSGSYKQATAATEALVGTADELGRQPNGGADVAMSDQPEVEAGAAVAAGDPLTSDAQGRAVKAATTLALAEALRFGTTSVSDMYYFCDEICQAVAESGIKANISRGTSMFLGDDFCFDTFPACQELVALKEKWHDYDNGRIKIEASVHAEYTSTYQLWDALAEYAINNGLQLQVHLSETKKEHDECVEKYGLTPAQVLDCHHVFDVPTVAAHCVHVTQEDMQLLAKRHVSAAHCPVSNLKLASGCADVLGMVKAGMNVCLGTDSVASNNNLDLFEEIKAAALMAKGKTGDPTAVPAEAAQQVADQLIAGGIKGIWNFAPTHLDVPPNILVQYENMATSLAVLSVHLQAQIKEEKEVRK